MNWRAIADWAKRHPVALMIADKLGRTRGRLCALDRLIPPAPPPPIKPDLSGWGSRQLSAVWIGHATVLLRIGGMTVLTDPVFSERVGLGFGLMTVGPRRRFAPAVALSKLPAVDLILVSHAHFDHLDRPTLVRMKRSTPVITSLNNADLIADLGFRNVRELPVGGVASVGTVRVTARQVAHWGPRTFLDTHRQYCAFLIESGRHRVLFGGDCGFGPHFDDLRHVDLAILGIGGYDPFVAAHATPEQAWEMFTRMGARRLLPIHHSTFRLSNEPADEPIKRLRAAAGQHAGMIAISEIGGVWTSDE